MTAKNPIQPPKGNRDDASSRSNDRDESSRTFRTGGVEGSQPQGQSRDGDNSEVLRCLDTIEENCRKVRKSLSGSNLSSANASGTRQAMDRQSNEGGAISSHPDSKQGDAESRDGNRNSRKSLS